MSSLDFFNRIKVIAKQIAHDRGKEAKYSVQMNSLCNIISSPENLQQLQENWEKVANELCFVFASRCSQHLKNSSAKCMGQIGYLAVAENFESFVKYLHEKYHACQKSEERGFYLVSLHEFVRCFVENNKCVLPDDIKAVMDFSKAFLDTNESNMELILVLDICLTIAKNYPFEFASYVHDICDFVIGWFMDRDEPRFVEEKCRETIRAFHPFFRNDVNEAIVFLDSLMDDFLLIVERDDKEIFLKSDDGKLESAISSLIVFEEIYKSAIDHHNVSAVIKLIVKVEENFDAIEKRLCLIDVKQGNECAIKLADVFFQFYLSSVNATHLDKCLRLVDHCLHSSQISSDQFTNLLVFCNKMLTVEAENVNKIKILKRFITKSDNLTPPYLHNSDDDLCKKLCFFFSKFLDTSNLETIQTTYRLIVDELQNQFSCLKKLLDEKVLYNEITKQENFAISLLASLKPVAIAKNSIIVLRGLDPSLFSFLFYTLPMHEKWLITFFPKCFYLLLCLAKAFAETHNHFIAHSELFTSTMKSSFMIEAPTAKFFGRILSVLSALLSNVEIMSGEALVMVMKWLDNVCKNTGELTKGMLSNSIVAKINEILLLMFADNIFSKNSELNAILLFSIKHFHAFSLLLSNTDFASTFSNRLKFTMEKMELKECAVIVSRIPSTIFMRVLIKSKDIVLLPATEQSLLGKSVMAPFQFQMLTNFLVNSVAPSFSSKTSFDSNWFIDSAEFLYRDFILEQPGNNKVAKHSERLKALADISTLQKWHFIINHFALFCIENRLKTPIGKAMDTFSRFEGAIKTATAELSVHTAKLSEEYCNKVDCQLRIFGGAVKAQRGYRKVSTEITASKESIEDEENEPDETRHLLSKREECLRVDLLLSLIDTLDKLMVYAVRGSVYNFAEISQGSSQFFFTNESTCQGWMSRITPPLMATCFAAGRFSQIIRLSGSIFTEIEQRLETCDEKKVIKIDPATTLIVCWLIRAMVELSAVQAICGVYRWVKEVFNVEMTWICYAEKLAAGSFEAALNGFNRVVKEEKLHHYVVKAIREMSLKAVKSIRNIDITSQYHDVLFSESVKSTGKDDDIEKKIESNNGFEEMQLKSALALSQWSDFESLGIQRLNGLEGLTSNCCLPWNLQKYSEEIELNMLRILTISSSKTNKNKAESRTELNALNEDLIQILQIGITSCRDDALTLVARNSAFKLVHNWLSEQQRSVIYTVENRRTKNIGAFESLDFSSILDGFAAHNVQIGNRIEIGQLLCIWLDRLSALSQTNQSTRTSHQHQKANALGAAFRRMLINGHAEMAQLTARSGNIALSQFHLVKYTQLLNSNEPNQYHKFGNDATMISPSLRFEEQHPIFTNGYYYHQNQHNITTTSIAMHSVNSTVDLKEFLRASKLVWQFSDNKNKAGQDGVADVRFSCFGDMIDVLRRQLDDSITGGQRSASDTPQHKALLARMCICLGRWNSALPSAINILFQKHATGPDPFLQQVMHSREFLEDSCVGMEDALSGSFFLTASSLATGFVKTHRVMADWALLQMYEKVDEESDDGGEVLRVSVNEMALFRRMGLNLSFDQRRMLILLGKCDTLEKFSSELISQVEANCSLQSIFDSPDFVQTWIIVKRRQFKLFEILLNSSIHLLENVSAPADCTDNYQRPIVVMSTCLRVLKMLTDQPDWFSKVVELNWIVRIQCDIWKEIIPRLFALLNHSNLYVRQTVCRILERIGEMSPYAICFPTITNGGAEAVYDSIINKENEENLNIEKAKWSDDDTRNANVLTQRFQEHINIRETADQDHVQTSCQQLAITMYKVFPQLLKDVTNFCMEMHKISLLREEQWLFVLSSLDVVVGRVVRQQQAYLELEGDDYLGIVGQNALKRRNDCVILMVYNILKDLYESTCAKSAQTNNEKQFRLIYKSTLSSAIEQYDSYCGTDLTTAWEPFRKVIDSMNMRAMKRSALCFSAQEISLYLSQLSASSIPIPGQLYNRFRGGVVTIHKVHKNIYVLPTKTRPKKINFIGSDGKEYSFLFKCHEDLHLDERVMQLLRVCNMILSDRKCPASDMQSVADHNYDRYSCSSYSVTPLGPRCGLIEWVDGATPLFQIYRKWMVREMEMKENRRIQTDLRNKNHQQLQQSVSSNSTVIHTNKYAHHVKNTDQRNRLLMKEVSSIAACESSTTKKHQNADPPPPMAEPERPTELYHTKLKAIFTQEGLSKDKMRKRQQWPLYCQKQALREMINDTPRDILAKELWMRAGDSATWWRVTEHFACTAAAASMIGSVIGLGDRHLDNVLVNLSSGQIVHVDYNVCFERGRHLRIPEVIPFRLTGNIARALGPTQIEGTFRESCIDVLSQFRRHREVLLSTLDVFVNDPLLDWSTEKEFRFAKSMLNVGLLFAVYGAGNAVDNHDRIEKKIGTPLMSTNQAKKNLINAMNRLLELGSCGVDEMLNVTIDVNCISNTITKPSANQPCQQAEQITERIRRKLNGREIIESTTNLTLEEERMPWSKFVHIGDENMPETERMTAEEQVDFLIKKATDVTNLTLLYEGWTAWV